MKKQMLLVFLCCTLTLFSAAALSGCGKEKDDLIQQGLTYIENGQYEKARKALQSAAQEDPEDVQAKETYRIVDAYLKAKEAHELGDDDAAAEYLENLPERYLNLPIAEDIDALLRSLQSSLPDAKDREDDQTARTTQRPAKDSATTAPSQDKNIFSAQEEIALQLQEAKELLDTGLYANALDCLERLDMTYATTQQKSTYNQIKEDAEKGRSQAEAHDAAHPDQQDFTSEKAMEYLKKAYPSVSGDMGLEELPAQYDEDDRKYYELSLQYEGDVITVRIFADGSVVQTDD